MTPAPVGDALLDWLRSYRFAGFALFDLTLAFGAAWLATPYLQRRWGLKPEAVMLSVLPLSVGAHLLTGRVTALTQLTVQEPWVRAAMLGLLGLAITR